MCPVDASESSSATVTIFMSTGTSHESSGLRHRRRVVHFESDATIISGSSSSTSSRRACGASSRPSPLDTTDVSAASLDGSFLESAARSVTDMAEALFCSPSSSLNAQQGQVEVDEDDAGRGGLSSWTVDCAGNQEGGICQGASPYEIVVRATNKIFGDVLQKVEEDVGAILSATRGPDRLERDWYWQSVIGPFQRWLATGDYNSYLGIVDGRSLTHGPRDQQHQQQRVVQNRIGMLQFRARKVRTLREQLQHRHHRPRAHHRRYGCGRNKENVGPLNRHLRHRNSAKGTSKDDWDLILMKREVLEDRSVHSYERQASHGLLWDIVLPACPIPDDGTIGENDDDEEDLFYDSDPGVSASSYNLSSNPIATKRRGAAVAGKAKDKGAQAEDSHPGAGESKEDQRSPLHEGQPGQDERNGLVEKSASLLDISFSTMDDDDDDEDMDEYTIPEPPDKPFDIYDDYLVSQFVKETTLRTTTLTWHPPLRSSIASSGGKIKPPSRPVCVKSWVELGSRLAQHIVEPKLMWSEAYQPDLQHRKQLNSSSVQPYEVRLIAICRILPFDDRKGASGGGIDRKDYPFAKASCSFTIHTYEDEQYLFEASSREERDFVVQSMKLMVARFMSLAVAGEIPSLLQEFFIPMDGEVTGGDPRDSCWHLSGNNG